MWREARHALELAGLLGLREPLRRLPPERSLALGAWIGRRYARAGLPRTADALVNLRLAFPDQGEGERQQLLERSFANLGRYLAELCLLQGPHRDRLLAGIEVEGREHYEAARRASDSGGLIALTAHFGSWELCATGLAVRGYPVSVVHQPLANPGLEARVHDWRRAAKVEEIPLGRAATGVFRALARGRAVAMLLDQNAHRDEGLFAPFFGQAALTRSGPALIAMSRGIPVLPTFLFRVRDTPRHVVKMLPPLELEPGELESGAGDPDGALQRNVARMNAVIESVVRQAPDHWLWPHRRFRTRPAGEAPVYAARRRRRAV